MKNIEEIEKILSLHKEGYSYNQIAKICDTSKSIVAFYCNEKRSKHTIHEAKEKMNRNFEYEEIICKLVKESDNINQVCKKLHKRATNNNYDLIRSVIAKYNLDITHFTNEPEKNEHKYYSDEELFTNNDKFHNLKTIKRRLLLGGYKEYKCECCGLENWNNQPIVLQLHHVNGDRYDNNIGNLQLLCPNCHSQTDNFCVGKHNKNVAPNKICEKCGNIFTPKNKKQRFCSKECANNSFIIEQDKEKIFNLLKECNGNFSKASKRLGISDNALRKRCLKYGLPKYTSEIKKLIK